MAFNFSPESTSAEHCLYEPANVYVQVTPRFGDFPLILGDTVFTLDGRGIVFTRLDVLLGELALRSDTFKRVQNSIIYIENAGVSSHMALAFPKASFRGLRFRLGLDTSVYGGGQINSGQLGTADFSAMWSDSEQAYRFMVLEGMVDTSAAVDGLAFAPFSFQLGYPEEAVFITLDDLAPMAYSGNKLDIRIAMLVNELLMDVDFRLDHITDSEINPEIAQKLSARANEAFILE